MEDCTVHPNELKTILESFRFLLSFETFVRKIENAVLVLLEALSAEHFVRDRGKRDNAVIARNSWRNTTLVHQDSRFFRKRSNCKKYRLPRLQRSQGRLKRSACPVSNPLQQTQTRFLFHAVTSFAAKSETTILLDRL
jgi:hypothetical protein